MSTAPQHHNLTPAELYLACTLRKETKGMGYPDRLDASTLTDEDIATYRSMFGDAHARPVATLTEDTDG